MAKSQFSQYQPCPTVSDVYKRQVFAQLERETIQKRVTDAYYSRCLKGFHMSGQAPYGYQLEPTVVEGIRTKKMVADPVAADHVRLMFEMYAEPETSFGDITRYFEEPVSYTHLDVYKRQFESRSEAVKVKPSFILVHSHITLYHSTFLVGL